MQHISIYLKKPTPMKKQIIITIEEPAIITNPPQPERMQLQIEGLLGIEAAQILLSAASQIASKELPPIIQAIKATHTGIGPMAEA